MTRKPTLDRLFNQLCIINTECDHKEITLKENGFLIVILPNLIYASVHSLLDCYLHNNMKQKGSTSHVNCMIALLGLNGNAQKVFFTPTVFLSTKNK